MLLSLTAPGTSPAPSDSEHWAAPGSSWRKSPALIGRALKNPVTCIGQATHPQERDYTEDTVVIVKLSVIS